MKNKTAETILLAYSASVEHLSSIPMVEEETPELTDEQIDLIIDGATETVSDTYRQACELLEAIKAEEPHFQQIAEKNERANRLAVEEQGEQGLTSEINSSTTITDVSDTVENVAALLRRHRYGFKNGSRNSKGVVIVKPYTEAENETAEKWLECIKNGTSVVAVEDTDGE